MIASGRLFSRLFAILALAAITAADRDARAEESVLASDRYAFCHDRSYRLNDAERAFCPLVDGPTVACPALPDVCKNPPWDGDPAHRSLPLTASAKPPPTSPPSAPSARPSSEPSKPPPPRSPEPAPRDVTSPSAAGSAMSGLAWVVLILLFLAGCAAVVFAVKRNTVEGGDDPEAEGASPGDAARSEAPEIVETDASKLLGRARDLAARGDYGRAIELSYAALLRQLDGQGLIEVHPSRTSGDYVRALGDHDRLQRDVRDVSRDVERVKFGDVPASADVYAAITARVAPLLGKIVAIAIVAIGLGAQAACASDHALAAGTKGAAVVSPSSAQGFVDLLTVMGRKVRYRSASLAKLEGRRTVVLMPDATLSEAEMNDVLVWVEGGGTLVTAGPLPASEGLTIRRGPTMDDRLWSPSLKGAAPRAPAGSTLDLSGVPDDASQLIVARGSEPYIARVRHGKGAIIAFADGALLTSIALAAGQNEAFLRDLFNPLPGDVELVDRFSVAGTPTPFSAIGHAGLWPAVLQLFALVALFMLYRGVSFGAPRDPKEISRRAFAEHARALGLAYARAGAARHALGLFAGWAIERLRERVPRGHGRGLHLVAEAIAKRTGEPEGHVMSTLVEALAARDEAAPPTSIRGRGELFPKRRETDAKAEDLARIHALAGYLSATKKAE